MSEFKKRESLKSPDYYPPPSKTGAAGAKQTKPTTNGGGTLKNGGGKNAYPYAQNAGTPRNERERSFDNDDDDNGGRSARRTSRPASRNSNIRQMSPDTIEIERLKAQINQEEQLRQAVEQSYNELLSTSKELEKRMNMIDEEIQSYDQIKEVKYNNKKPPLIMYEGNEWKTRFENQEEINRQLSKQIGLLDAKLESTKHKVKTTKSRGNVDRNEAAPEHIAELQKTKQSLIAQLRDYEWRLEQENKAYHKANEERKELHQEILDIRNQLTAIKENNAHHQHPLTSRLGAHKPTVPPIYTSLSNNKLDAIDNNDYTESSTYTGHGANSQQHLGGNSLNGQQLNPSTRYPNNY